MDQKTLYRYAVQSYILREEEAENDTPTVAEAKEAVNAIIERMENAKEDAPTFIISSNEGETVKLIIREYEEMIELKQVTEDTDTDIILEQVKMTLPRDTAEEFANLIINCHEDNKAR